MPLVEFPEGSLPHFSLLLVCNWTNQAASVGMEYVGADIVTSVISTNRKRYSTTNFLVTDFSQTPPFKPFDIIFCRDALQHLSFVDIKRSLENFNRSGSKFLFVTFYSNAAGTGAGTHTLPFVVS